MNQHQSLYTDQNRMVTRIASETEDQVLALAIHRTLERRKIYPMQDRRGQVRVEGIHSFY